MQYPKNMIDFLNNFSTEEQCLKALEDIRWGGKCPKCGSPDFWRHGTRRTRICSLCRAHLSVTADTVFHRLRIPLRAVFLIGWYMVMSKQGVSSEELSNLLGISPPTAWLWNQKFRKIMVREDRSKLGGHVEVDEIFIGGTQSGPRGRGAKGKKIAVVAVEVNKEKKNTEGFFRGMGRTRIKIIPNCSEKTLLAFIQKNVEVGSTIYTDGWTSYNSLDKKGYNHILEKGSVSTDEVIGVHQEEVTPHVHIIASLVKRWLLGTHQQYLARNEYLQDYLEEYTFRFNRRKSSNRGKLFQTLLEQILSYRPTTRKAIQTHEKHLPERNTKLVVTS